MAVFSACAPRCSCCSWWSPWSVGMAAAGVDLRPRRRVYWICDRLAAHRDCGARVICGVRARMHGLRALPRLAGDPAAKHQSTWETFAFPTLMPHPLCYVFKRELLCIPFFGWAMARMDMIHIDRSKRAEAWSARSPSRAAASWPGPLGHHVPRGHAHAARRQGTTRTAAPARGRDRRAGAADRGHLGALLAAQELRAATRRHRRVDRRADRVGWPRAPTS